MSNSPNHSLLQSSYKTLARTAVSSAKSELKSGDDHRLKFAALELRFGIEALTYHRLLMYKDEIPSTEYAKWQPHKVLEMLLSIYADVDKPSVISITKEGSGRTFTLGHDTPVSLAHIKEHYSALGSYLHTPALNQIEKGRVTPDYSRMRKRCEAVVEVLDRALQSNTWSNFGNFSKLANCHECGKPVRRRLTEGQDRVRVPCFHCDAEYWLIQNGENGTLWEPIVARFRCRPCDHVTEFWPKQVVEGATWECSCCGQQFQFQLGFVPIEKAHLEPADPESKKDGR